MGTGHVKRCQSLGYALRKAGNEVHFVWRDQGLDLAPWLNGFSSTQLPAERTQTPGMTFAEEMFAGTTNKIDAVQTLALLEAVQPDWLLVDHYAFDERWHRVAGVGPWSIAAIDDLADRPLAVDLLIDQNYDLDHQRKYAGVLSRETVILGGPRYAMLGPNYADVPVVEISENVDSIGVFMGGSDPLDASSVVLDALDMLPFSGRVEVVTTVANPHRDRLRERCRMQPNWLLSVDLPDLAGFYSRHGLHVGAGGSTTWERCRLGVPALAIICAENQREVVHLLVEAGVQFGLDAPDRDQIAAAISSLLCDFDVRRRLSDRASILVDGHGAERIAECLLSCRAISSNRDILT